MCAFAILVVNSVFLLRFYHFFWLFGWIFFSFLFRFLYIPLSLAQSASILPLFLSMCVYVCVCVASKTICYPFVCHDGIIYAFEKLLHILFLLLFYQLLLFCVCFSKISVFVAAAEINASGFSLFWIFSWIVFAMVYPFIVFFSRALVWI